MKKPFTLPQSLINKICSLTAIVFLAGMSHLHAQAPTIQWEKTYGGSKVDGANYIQQTRDGGYIYSGYSNSTDGDVTGGHGDVDCWIVKVDALGSIQWERSLGGNGYDQGGQVKEDVNGGYIVAAYTVSDNGDVTGGVGGGDGWVIKLDDTGGIVWETAMGSTGFDFFNAVSNTPDSGYIVVGAAGGNNGDITGFGGGSEDLWVVKFTKTGTVSWNKVYGGTAYEIGFDLVAASDNGCYIAALEQGNDTSISGYHGGVEDAWVIRLDDTGGVMWSKVYGGSMDDKVTAITKTPSGNYILSGYSNSSDGDVVNNHGGFDYWTFAINDTGKMLWTNCYGGPHDEVAFTNAATFDGGAIIGGYASSSVGEVTGNHGSADYWVVKVDDTGTIVWEQSFGGSLGDSVNAVIQMVDSGFALTGTTASSNGDVTANHGHSDLWTIKLNKSTTTSVNLIAANNAIQVYPTLTGGVVHIVMPQGYEHAAINMVDVTGNQCGNISATSGLNRTVNISNVPAGMYLLQVVNGREVNTYKVVYHP